MTEANSPPTQEYRGLGPPLGPSALGQRLDLFLAQTFPFYSRGEWKAVCQRGHLRVNGRVVRASHKLKAGDKLERFHPLDDEPEVDTGIELLHEDRGIMAVFKPGNLPMHEVGPFRRKTFAALVHEQLGPEWFPVHRLDRETSGIVLCAATTELRNRLSVAFETRDIEKLYVAIVTGRLEQDEIDVDQPLGEETNDKIPRFVVSAGGMPSRTVFRVMERSDHATLLEARPYTGRPNQIRVHAAWLGHHVLGDKVYHADPAVYHAYWQDGNVESTQLLAGFPRHALHAAKIAFEHPLGGRFEVESPLPADLRALWRRQ